MHSPPFSPCFTLALAAVILHCAALPGDLLAVSDFLSDEQPYAQDWVVTYGVPGVSDKVAAAAAASNVVMTREGGGGMGDGLKGADTGAYKWYFTSPPSLFAFDTTSAYNGIIQWRLQSLSWRDSFSSSPPPDIILSCSPKSLSLMAKAIATDRFGGSVFSMPLNETANWFLLKPSSSGIGAAKRLRPTRSEFLQCLAGMQTVSIRGGYYDGAEKTVLKFVKVFEGVIDASPTQFKATASDLVSAAAVGGVGHEYSILWNRPGSCNQPSARITIAQAASIDLCPQPVGTWVGTDDLVYPRGPWLKAPFIQNIGFKAVPPICTSATLAVSVVGRASQRLTLGPNNYVTVYAGTDTRMPLGKLFNNQDALLNEDRNLFELSDSLAIAAVHMAGLTAGGGQIIFSLRSSPAVDFEFKITSAVLRWRQGTCMSMLLTSTSRLQDATFKGSSSTEAARALDADSVELQFRMPAAVSSQVSGDGAAQLMAEGDTGPSNYVDVMDAFDRSFGTMFKDEQVTSQSEVIWKGRATTISPTPSTVFTFEGVGQPEDKVVGAFLRVSDLWEKGEGQERKIVAWNAATGMATLESEWDARSVPTLQTTLEIVRVSYFFLQNSAPVRVPLQLRTQWIPLPRSFASLSSNGHLTLRLRVRSSASLLSKIRVPVVRLVFPLVGGYIDVLRPGSIDLLGVALSRPSYEIFRFRAPPKLPLGPGTIIAEIFFQDHVQLVERSSGNTKTDRGDNVDIGVAMELGQDLPLAPQQLYPHGYSAVRILAGDRGESVGFFLADDYSQYEPSAPFVSHVHVSQATLAALVAAGDLHFTLVIPPGTGVIRVMSLAISYPAQ